jgi:hypothetical protein
VDVDNIALFFLKPAAYHPVNVLERIQGFFDFL